MFSKRADWTPRINRLTRVREELARRNEDVLDLTVSNPTQAAIESFLRKIQAADWRGR